MYAIVEILGQQFKVEAGKRLYIHRMAEADRGAVVEFDKVLLTSDGKDFKLGKPYIAGVVVEAKVLKQGRDKKIHVLKYKAKSKYRRKIGHRQHFTEVEITKI